VLALALAAAACTPSTAADAGADAPPLADVVDAVDAVAYPPAYTETVLDDARIGSDSTMADFQKARGALDLHDGPFARVTLTVVLGTTCFPFANWSHDPQPAGQNWPADCDAFDRNFELTLDEPGAPSDPPAIELARAITPFGGPMTFTVDITDVANGRPRRHTLQAFIATYSDATGQVTGSSGGWNVTARVDAQPGPPPRNVLAVVPLFNTVQTSATPASATFAIDAPANTVASRVEYRVTGHGGGSSRGDLGCAGPAEEFCDRTHTITVDGATADALDAWRDDCADNCTIAHQGPVTGGFDYCTQNPCGNVDSVRAPRANWCPGTLTPPFVLDYPALRTPGHHTFGYAIDRIDAGGSWRMSGVYFAFGP
jgi:hypothetical protein